MAISIIYLVISALVFFGLRRVGVPTVVSLLVALIGWPVAITGLLYLIVGCVTLFKAIFQPLAVRRLLTRIEKLDEREAPDDEYTAAFDRLHHISSEVKPKRFIDRIRSVLLQTDGKSRKSYLALAGRFQNDAHARGLVKEIAERWNDPLGHEARQILRRRKRKTEPVSPPRVVH